jgi:hypothetical protein
MEPVINDENDMDTDQEREQADQEPTDGEDSVATPSQSRSPSAHPLNDLMDVFDGYSFKGRRSVIIEGEEDVSEEEASTGPDIHHKEQKKPSAPKSRGQGPKRNRREKSGVPALDRDLSNGNDDDEVRTERGEEDEDWDFLQAGGEERNGARDNDLFARGVVDRHKVAVFPKGSTPNRSCEAAEQSALDGPNTPGPRRRADALQFRRTPNNLLRTKSLLSASTQSSLSRGKLLLIKDRPSRSTISTTQSLHTARTTLGGPSLKSKESNVSVGSARSSSNTSTRGDARASSVRISQVVTDEQEKHQKNNKKSKRGTEKMLSLFASPP